MKHINYFKKETDKHRSPMARRQQQWNWLRKMKRIKCATRADFIEAAYSLWHGTKAGRVKRKEFEAGMKGN